MTLNAMKSYNVAAAIAVAQSSLLRASASWSPTWPGNTGQCIVDPQPGYNFTALQICTTIPTYYTTNDVSDSGKTFTMNGSLYSAFLTTGSDPLVAIQPVTPNFWINTMQYAEWDGDDTQPTRFYPPHSDSDFDLSECTPFACQDSQPCAPWGNAGSPWEVYDDPNTDGAFTWWNDTRQETYGPGNGYLLLDYMNTDPPVLNLRDTGTTWFNCARATRAPCTDIDGAVVTYLYDCKPDWVPGAPEHIPAPVGKSYNGNSYNGGINNRGDVQCTYGGNEGAIGTLTQAVNERLDDSTLALTGQPMYCNFDDQSEGGSGNICIYYQGTATGNGALTKSLMNQLNEKYKGDVCGNIPVEYPVQDWLAFGYLTVSGNAPNCEPCTPLNIAGSTACACPGFPS